MSARPRPTTRIVVVAAVFIALAAFGAVTVAHSLPDVTTPDGTVTQNGPMDEASSSHLTGIGVAAAQPGQPGGNEPFVRGSPDIDVVVADPTLQRGSESTVTLQVLNSGKVDAGVGNPTRVTTARGVSVSPKANDGAPFDVTTDTVAVGTLTRDAPASVPITVSVPADAEAGKYDLEVEVEYEYTELYAPRSNAVSEATDTETVTVTVIIEDGARFRIVDADTDAPVGGSGNLSLTIENVGEAAASDARITTGGETIQPGSGTQVVGGWEPGERKTVTYDVAVAPEAQPVPQELTTTVQYTDQDGREAASHPMVAGVTPAPAHSFTVSDVDSTLAVGDNGQVTMTLENDGPEPVEGVVVTVSNGQALGLAGEEYAVGDLEVGEAETVTFETTIGASTNPGPRLLMFDVSYRTGDERRSDHHDVTASVAPASDEFSITVVNSSLTAGSSEVLELAVTNERNHTVSDVSAKVFAENPLTALDDEAFVAELEPGETAVLRFEYRASGSALPKEYPVALDFQYEDHRGETRMSETYRVPVTVEESGDSGAVPTSLLAVAGIAALGAVGFAYRRRHS